MDPSQIQEIIRASISTKEAVLADEDLLGRVLIAVETCLSSYRQGCKLLFCGNGGSAADAQHLAAELSGRFYYDRPPLYAEALHTNSSYLTAVANDYGYEEVYARTIKAIGKRWDVLFAMSTSGNSANIVKAAIAARQANMVVIAMTGADGGELKNHCELLLNIPSNDTARIQECHLMLGHLICQLIESTIYPR